MLSRSLQTMVGSYALQHVVKAFAGAVKPDIAQLTETQ